MKEFISETAFSIILPTSYWGSIQYYLIISHFDAYVQLNENYQKKSSRNRCQILSPNGRINLSVPLQKGKNNKAPISSVAIYNNEPWKTDHLKSIKNCYGKSPYYAYYLQEIEALYNDQLLLIDLNQNIMQWICRRFLNIEPIKALNLAKKEDISACGLDFFENYVELDPYHQVFDYKYPFQSNLSILDMIFNLGPELRLHLGKVSKEEILERLFPYLTKTEK